MEATQEMTELASLIGTAVDEDIQHRAAWDPAFGVRWEAGSESREIAWLLIKFRMDHGLTQQDLAERIGATVTHIAHIESGRHQTSLRTLRRIARTLDLKVDSIPSLCNRTMLT